MLKDTLKSIGKLTSKTAAYSAAIAPVWLSAAPDLEHSILHVPFDPVVKFMGNMLQADINFASFFEKTPAVAAAIFLGLAIAEFWGPLIVVNQLLKTRR